MTVMIPTGRRRERQWCTEQRVSVVVRVFVSVLVRIGRGFDKPGRSVDRRKVGVGSLLVMKMMMMRIPMMMTMLTMSSGVG
jgi:hypothetical protein